MYFPMIYLSSFILSLTAILASSQDGKPAGKRPLGISASRKSYLTNPTRVGTKSHARVISKNGLRAIAAPFTTFTHAQSTKPCYKIVQSDTDTVIRTEIVLNRTTLANLRRLSQLSDHRAIQPKSQQLAKENPDSTSLVKLPVVIKAYSFSEKSKLSVA